MSEGRLKPFCCLCLPACLLPAWHPLLPCLYNAGRDAAVAAPPATVRRTPGRILASCAVACSAVCVQCVCSVCVLY